MIFIASPELVVSTFKFSSAGLSSVRARHSCWPDARVAAQSEIIVRFSDPIFAEASFLTNEGHFM